MNLTHTIRWTIHNGYVSGSVTCEAASDADCRLTGDPGCTCESWVIEHDEQGPFHYVYDGEKDSDAKHRMQPSNFCNAVEWWENCGDIGEAHLGSEQELQNGPIEALWEDDGYRWRYPSEPDPVAPVVHVSALGDCMRAQAASGWPEQVRLTYEACAALADQHEAAALAESAQGRGPHAAAALRWAAEQMSEYHALYDAYSPEVLQRLADGADRSPAPRVDYLGPTDDDDPVPVLR